MQAERDSILARIVTGTRGTFSFTAPASKPVRVRVLRIGYESTNAGPFTLLAGQTETVRIKLNEKRVVLETFDVASTKQCEVKPNGARLVAQLYEETRKALLASTSATSNERNQAQFTLYTRTQDDKGRIAAPVARNVYNGPSSKPFASLSADSLAKVGYVVEEKDGTVYRAPDAGVLLSDVFLAGHCLQLANGTGDRAPYLGIQFQPVVNQDTRIDVRGTLWLDRESNELKFLEYEYVGIPETHAKAGVGGRVEYTQVGAGRWFVNKWEIRMPRTVTGSGGRIAGMRGNLPSITQIAGLQITGGEVEWLKLDDDIVYANAGAAQAGSSPKDVLDLKVGNNSFEVAGGAQKVASAAPVPFADTLVSTSACEAVATPGYTGQVTGRVRDTGSRPADKQLVIAEWREDFRMAGSRDITWQTRRLQTNVNAKGEYTLCGLPLARQVTLVANQDKRVSRSAMVLLTPAAMKASMNLLLDDAAVVATAEENSRARGAMVVVTDQRGAPVPFASVTISGSFPRVADADGRLRINMASRDTLLVVARKIGYKQFEGRVVRDSANGPFRISMSTTAQMLNAVNVTGARARSPLELTGFYERVSDVQRGAHVAEFYTPEQLEARPATTITQFLAASQYANPVKGYRSWVFMGRGGCPMAILLDGQQLTHIINVKTDEYTEKKFRDSLKFDVNDMVSMSQVAAIEVYPSVATAPTSIATAVKNGNCGIVAIWTGGRR